MTGSEYQQNYGGSFTVDPAAFKNAVMVGDRRSLGRTIWLRFRAGRVVGIPGESGDRDASGRGYRRSPRTTRWERCADSWRSRTGRSCRMGFMDTGAVEVHGAYPPSSWLRAMPSALPRPNRSSLRERMYRRRSGHRRFRSWPRRGLAGTQSPLHLFTPCHRQAVGEEGDQGVLGRVFRTGRGRGPRRGARPPRRPRRR